MFLRAKYPATVAACALLASGCQSAESPALSAGDVLLYAPLPGAEVAVGYLTLTNGTDTELTIDGVRSPQFDRVEFHETVVSDGVSRMRRAPLPVVPARGTLKLEPGGRHLMLIGPHDGVDAGQPVAIVFESAATGDVIVRAELLSRLATEDND